MSVVNRGLGSLKLILLVFFAAASSGDALAESECPFDAPWLSESTAAYILRSLRDHQGEVHVSEESDSMLLQLFLWSKLTSSRAPFVVPETFDLNKVAGRSEDPLNGLVWLVAHDSELAEKLNLDVDEHLENLGAWIERQSSLNPHQVIALSRFRQANFGLPGVSLQMMLENVNGPVGEVFFHVSSELESRGKKSDAYAALRVSVEYSVLRGFIGLFDYYIGEESCHDRAAVVQLINRAIWFE
ncbi:MAG: hypothetical protein ACXIUB_01745 [Wenzhouxiangella sp.]